LARWFRQRPPYRNLLFRMKSTPFCLVLALFTVFAVRPSLVAGSEQTPHSHPSQTTAKAAHYKTMAHNPYLGAIVVDAASGRVLFQDQADTRGYPASMQKLMDLLIIMEKVEHGQLSLTDQVPVSAKAAKTGGSQVYLAEKEIFSLDEMLYALMVQSANDAAVALAEKVSGSTDAFVELMNAKAKQLGMTSTVFHSVHGLPPAPGQEHDVTTARDFSILCREVVKHPDALRYTSTREHVFRANVPGKNIAMHNHNHLLARIEGCDGLKTGFFNQAGFSIAVTAARQGQRVIVVVLDSPDLKTRDHKAAELVAKGFAALGGTAPARSASAHPAATSAK
jgi:serine-type D-Ala-D-Ala carboxypeptidase (penicillin-binding protein 5/6)